MTCIPVTEVPLRAGIGTETERGKEKKIVTGTGREIKKETRTEKGTETEIGRETRNVIGTEIRREIVITGIVTETVTATTENGTEMILSALGMICTLISST